MRIVLLYHGEVDGASGRCIGSTDVALSPSGRRTMETLAAEWPYAAPTALITSSRKRAHAALTPFARRFGRLPVVEPRLDEQDFGEWDGKFWSVLHEARATETRRWLSDWISHAPPGGESFQQVSARALHWLEDMQASHAEDDLLLVSAHPGPIRALVCHALDVPLHHALQLSLAPGQITALRQRRERFELSYFNASRFEASLFGDFS